MNRESRHARENFRHRPSRGVAIAVSAAWQAVATEQGKRVEIDRESIAPGPGAALTAKGRIVLDKPIVDPKTSASYRVIEIESRYDCAERTHATLRRTYYKEDDSVLRQDEVRSPFDMPVRSGTPDDRLLREVCRPKEARRRRNRWTRRWTRSTNSPRICANPTRRWSGRTVKKDLQRLTQQSSAVLAGKAATPAVALRKSGPRPGARPGRRRTAMVL